jgi:hypothetical protein
MVLATIAVLAPNILRRLRDFWKICGPLNQAVSQRLLTFLRSGLKYDIFYVGQNYSTSVGTSV